MALGDRLPLARLRTGAQAGTARVRGFRIDAVRLRGGRSWLPRRRRLAPVPAAMLVGFLTMVLPWTAVVFARTTDPILRSGLIVSDPWSLLAPAWGAWALAGVLVTGVVALVAWARLRLPAPDLSRTAVAGVVALAAFAAWCAASVWLWSPSPTGAWQWTVIAVGMTVTTILGSFAGAQAEGRRGLVLGLLAIGVLTALIGTVDLLVWPEEARRLVSPLDPSANGLLIGLGLLVALGLDQAEHPQRRRWLRGAATLLIVALALTASRSAIGVTAAGLLILSFRGTALGWPLLQAALGAVPATATALLASGVARDGAPDDAMRALTAGLLLLGCALVAWNAARDLGAPSGLRRVARDRRAMAGAALAAIVIVVGLAASADGGIKGTWDRTTAAFEARSTPGQPADGSRLWSGTSDGRLWRWQASIDAFRQADEPVTGLGPGSAQQVLRRYRSDSTGVLTIPSAPLAVLTETGGVGLGLMLIAVLGLSLAARRERRKSPLSDGALLLTVGSAVALHTLFNDDHLQPLLLVPAFAALGALVARPSVEQRLAPTPTLNRPPAARSFATAFGVIAAVLVLLAALTPARAHFKTREAEVALNRGDAASLREAGLFAAQARQLDPLAFQGYAIGSQAALAQQRWTAARHLALESVRRAPREAAAWRAVAFVALAEHDRPGARAAARKLQQLDPASPITLQISRDATLDSAPPEASPTAIGTPLSPAGE